MKLNQSTRKIQSDLLVPRSVMFTIKILTHTEPFTGLRKGKINCHDIKKFILSMHVQRNAPTIIWKNDYAIDLKYTRTRRLGTVASFHTVI